MDSPHAGRPASGSTGGGQDTNTLILLHIFAGGERAVGFSIPRDDWVTFPQPYDGQSQGKIDQAYGLAYAQSLSQTVNSSMNSAQRYLQANRAGQAATIATVSAVTGQKIDHFAEVNLAGFYYLAGSFGGIEACVKPARGGENLADANSGLNAVLDGYNMKKGGAQYLHLCAPQALAFVRDRDTLPNGDLDRTHRQQAVLDYVIWKLKHNGILSDLGQLTALLSTAKQYLITDSTWKLLNFAPQMKALTGKNLQFYTAPIVGYATDRRAGRQPDRHPDHPGGHQGRSSPPRYPRPKLGEQAKPGAKAAPVPPASTVTVDVYNGGSAPGLATGVSRRLSPRATRRAPSPNATAQSQDIARAPRCSTGRARPLTRARSLATSARTPSRSPRCPPATLRCSSAPGPPWCRPALRPRRPLATPQNASPPRPRLVTTERSGGAVTWRARRSTASPACTESFQARRKFRNAPESFS